MDKAISSKPDCARAGACRFRGTSPSRTVRSASCAGSVRTGACTPDFRSSWSCRGLRIGPPHPVNEVLLAPVKAETSAVAFIRRISQGDDLWVFAVTIGAARFHTHGDLPSRNCHLPIEMSGACSPSILEGRRVQASRRRRQPATCLDGWRYYPWVYPFSYGDRVRLICPPPCRFASVRRGGT